MSQIDKVFVVGVGQMGLGIAQVCAQAGLEVWAYDKQQEALDNAQKKIERSLNKFVKKEQITEEQKTEILAKLHFSLEIEDAAQTGLVIEAIVENEEIKNSVWQNLDRICPETTIFASNTSSIPITRMAAKTSRPDRFIGMHFMNPVPVMSMVEVISGLATSEQTAQTVMQLAEKIGKKTIHAKDYPGFVINRILVPMINEAFYALMENLASPEDIDQGLKLGCNFPMGPLKLADFVGLDTCLSILEVLHKGLGQDKYAPCPLLRQYVEAGYMGVKSGRGVYTY